MTSPPAALPFGGMVSVLALWTLVVIGIGLSLFIYGIVVTLRDRRYGRRLRGRGKQRKRPANRRPDNRRKSQERRRPEGERRPAPSDNLPARREPRAPLPMRRALPSAPGYGPAPRYGATEQGPGPEPYPMPGAHPLPELPATPFQPRLALPAGSGTDQPQQVWPVQNPAPLKIEWQSATPTPLPTPTWEKQPAEQVPPPPERNRRSGGGGGGRRKRPDCAQLRTQCQRMRHEADTAVLAAEQGALHLAEVRNQYAAAASARTAAQRAHERAAQEAHEAVLKTRIERTPTAEEQQVAGTTTHAAFAAYRRGDLTAEQLREVFKRAEGWTPEHDRLTKEVTQRKADEAEALKTLEYAIGLERSAAEKAQIAAVSSRALDEEAQAAIDEAKAICAAAADCERGRRR